MFQDGGEEQPGDCALLAAAVLQQRSRRPGEPGGEPAEGSVQPREGNHHARGHKPQLRPHGAAPCTLITVRPSRQEQIRPRPHQ